MWEPNLNWIVSVPAAGGRFPPGERSRVWETRAVPNLPTDDRGAA